MERIDRWRIAAEREKSFLFQRRRKFCGPPHDRPKLRGWHASRCADAVAMGLRCFPDSLAIDTQELAAKERHEKVALRYAAMNPFVMYAELKQSLEAAVGATDDLLHLHAGLLILVVATVLFGRGVGSRLPIAMVYMLAIANELIDALGSSPEASGWEPALDIANTVLWPTLLFLLARRHRRVIRPVKPGSEAYFLEKYLRNEPEFRHLEGQRHAHSLH